MRSEGGNVIDLSRLCRAPQPLQARIKRREAGIPVIDVTFNGGQRFEMLVDTGASGTAITPQMAQALGVTSEGTASFSTAGGVVESPIGRVSSIAAGGVVVENVPVSINGFLEIGLLGQDFFGSYDVIIKQNTIEFRPR
jgi:aspartyl protease family protein